MAFVSAQQSRLFVGSFAYSSYARGYSSTATTDMLDVTTLADTSKQMIPGQSSSASSFDVLYDTTSFAHGNTWKSTTPLALTLLPSGTAITSECFMSEALEASFATTSPNADVVSGSLSTVDTGAADVGVVIAALAAVTGTGNGTAVDNGASSANGGVAHLHATAFSGLTSDTVKIEHSADNSTWATLATFTAVAGTTSQRLTVAAGTTVNRYLRVVDTVVGTGSCTRIVTFSRR